MQTLKQAEYKTEHLGLPHHWWHSDTPAGAYILATSRQDDFLLDDARCTARNHSGQDWVVVPVLSPPFRPLATRGDASTGTVSVRFDGPLPLSVVADCLFNYLTFSISLPYYFYPPRVGPVGRTFHFSFSVTNIDGTPSPAPAVVSWTVLPALCNGQLLTFPDIPSLFTQIPVPEPLPWLLGPGCGQPVADPDLFFSSAFQLPNVFSGVTIAGSDLFAAVSSMRFGACVFLASTAVESECQDIVPRESSTT